MPQLNLTNIGKQVVLSPDAASVRTVLELGSANVPSFSGLSFTGTDTPGLQLKSLTDAQITALATASALPNGSLLVSSTTNRARIRLNGVTEEVLTTAGGQQINGALTVSGAASFSATSTGILTPPIHRTSDPTTGIAFHSGFVFAHAGGRRMCFGPNPTFGICLPSVGGYGWCNDANDGFANRTLGINRNAADVVEINNGTAGTFRDLSLRNLTASGTGSFAANVLLANSAGVRFSSTSDPSGTSDSGIIRGGSSLIDVLATNGVRFRNGNNTADSPITCSNLTASGTVQATSFWSGAGNNTIVNGAGGVLFLQTGGVNRWQINSNHWVPVTTNVWDVGSTTQRVRDLYTGGINATGNAVVGEGTASVPSLQLGSTATGFAIAATGTSRIGVLHAGSVLTQLATTDVRISNGMMFSSSNSSTATAGSVDVSLSRLSPSTWQMGNGGVNALGSLNLTNLTASGTVTATGTATHTFGTTNVVTFTNGTIQTTNGSRTVNLDFDRTRYINPSSAYGVGTYLLDVSRAALAELIVANTFGNGAGTQGAFPVAMRVEGNLTASGTITYSSINFPELVTNGDFSVGTGWTLGTGWSISGGTAVATGVVSFADIQQNLPAVELGRTYIVSFTLTRTAGTGVQVYIGTSGSTLGLVSPAIVSQSGTYSFLFHKNSFDTARTLLFRGAADFSGTIDNVSVRRAF